MTLADYYFHDPALVLIPIEHLCPDGMRSEFAALIAARCGWAASRIDLFNTAFRLYWDRSAALAARTRFAPTPRLRNVGVVVDAGAVRPYVQLLNTSTWTLHASDFDPASSHPEFAAYLLVHGDTMAVSGEATTAALRNAAYWFDRTQCECAAFAAAAARSSRPDAAAFRALAEAIPWLRQLYHEDLRPPPARCACRPVPGTGLLVPRALEERPPALVRTWATIAHDAVRAFHALWHAPDYRAITELCDWLAGDTPPVLVTGRAQRILWDPATPDRIGSLRAELHRAAGVAVREVLADLRVIARHTRTFHAALVDPAALPPPAPNTQQRGYTYLHHTRHLIAYNLHEPGMERLQGPALPYARAMLGARTVHEWAHLAVDAGWVPQVAPVEEVAQRVATLASGLDHVITAAPAATQRRTATDLLALRAGSVSPGTALARILITRMPDYQANLLGRRFLTLTEQETYVRHNIRTLRGHYTEPQLWRMLIRYLAEYQYLAFSAVADPRAFFLHSTWFDHDFFTSGILDDARFDALAAAVARLCATYAVDEKRFRPVQTGQ